MSLSMVPLLIHSPDIPVEVRETLQAAYAVDHPEARAGLLQTAARLLYSQSEGELACSDVRELVGLPDGDCCS